jgi:hypothetical protein
MIQNARLQKDNAFRRLVKPKVQMLCWICDHTRRDRIRNDDVQDKLVIASIEEKPIQHRLQWFGYYGYIQQRSHEALVHSDILSHSKYTRRGRSRPRLTWEETIKKDLKE